MVLNHILPLYGISIHLRFTDKATFSPFHNAAVDAFLRYMLNIGEAYKQYFSIICPENGRLHYNKNDPYRFALFSTSEGLPHLNTLIKRLKYLPTTSVIKDRKAPLRDNLRLIKINNLMDETPITNATSITPLKYKHISQLAIHYQPLPEHPTHLHWRFIAPVRLLKKEHANHQGEARFIRNANEINAHHLIQRTLHSLHQLAPQSPPFPTEWGKEAQLKHINLFWVNTPYFNKNKTPRTLGGLMGSFTLTLPPQTPQYLIECLLVAQHIGIGQRRALGWGKFNLTTTKP